MVKMEKKFSTASVSFCEKGSNKKRKKSKNKALVQVVFDMCTLDTLLALELTSE